MQGSEYLHEKWMTCEIGEFEGKDSAASTIGEVASAVIEKRVMDREGKRREGGE